MDLQEKRVRARKKAIVVHARQVTKPETIHTLEGTLTASVGDWVITGVNGEQYPCKPDIFEKRKGSVTILIAARVSAELKQFGFQGLGKATILNPEILVFS